MRMHKTMFVALLMAGGVAAYPALMHAAPPANESPTSESGHRTPGQTLDDGAITTKVKAQLIADATTKARHIDVTTQGSVVTLKGAVNSDKERTRAVEIARATKGVKEVDDQLTVTP